MITLVSSQKSVHPNISACSSDFLRNIQYLKTSSSWFWHLLKQIKKVEKNSWKKFRFHRLRIRENMWWTHCRSQNSLQHRRRFVRKTLKKNVKSRSNPWLLLKHWKNVTVPLWKLVVTKQLQVDWDSKDNSRLSGGTIMEVPFYRGRRDN